MRRACLALLAVLVSCGLAACGRSDDRDIRSTLSQFVVAIRGRDYKRICDQLFAVALVQDSTSTGLSCEATLRIGFGPVREPTLFVDKVEVAKDKALAVVRSGAKDQQPSLDTVKLVRENGGWRIVSLPAPQPQPAP